MQTHGPIVPLFETFITHCAPGGPEPDTERRMTGFNREPVGPALAPGGWAPPPRAVQTHEFCVGVCFPERGTSVRATIQFPTGSSKDDTMLTVAAFCDLLKEQVEQSLFQDRSRVFFTSGPGGGEGD
jgi:hypothetical protein